MVSENTTVERAIGSLDARMTLMEGRVSRVEVTIAQRLDSLEKSLDEVHAAVISARGAWRAVAWISGVAGTIGAGVAAFVHWFVGTGVR